MGSIIFVRKVIVLVFLFLLFDFLLSLFLLSGLNKYFGFRNNPEIVINGSSMSMAGFNREEISFKTKRAVAAYAMEGVSVFERQAMLRHFFQMYPQGVKVVVYEVNPLIFSSVKIAENVYTSFYPYMDDITIDDFIKSSSDLTDYWIHKIIRTSRFDSRLIRLILMGYLNKFDNLKTNQLDPSSISQLIDQKGEVEIQMEQDNIEVFENTINLIHSNHAKTILVMMPMYYAKLETFNSDDFRKLCGYFEDFSSKKENISFMNLNQDSLIYNSGYFSDPLHFNVYGQSKITDLVSSFILEN